MTAREVRLLQEAMETLEKGMGFTGRALGDQPIPGASAEKPASVWLMKEGDYRHAVKCLQRLVRMELAARRRGWFAQYASRN
jgi:hypothetical protein